jgi:hypothetical protein
MFCPIAGYPNYIISNDGVIYSQRGELKHGITKKGYHLIGLSNGKRKYVHRLVYQHYGKDWDATLTIDHINGNKDDNRIENLRMATLQEQQFNTKCYNELGVKGVNRHGNKYRAQICFNHKQIHLGLFDTIEEASNAYETKAQELHGEFYRGIG